MRRGFLFGLNLRKLKKKKLLHEKFKDMQLFLKEEKKKHTNQLSELKHGVHFK